MIVHVDLDAFYASVAQRDDPSLRGVPLAVSGSSRRAVVLTASYEARPFGVRSAMPLYRARELCPQLTVVAPDFPRYRESSDRVFAIFEDGTRAVEGLSLDEAFLDLETGDVAEATAFCAPGQKPDSRRGRADGERGHRAHQNGGQDRQRSRETRWSHRRPAGDRGRISCADAARAAVGDRAEDAAAARGCGLAHDR